MRRDRIGERDDRLGAALRALAVPEHRPGFDLELHRRLAGERLASPAGGRARRLARRGDVRWGLRIGAIAAVAAVVAVAIGLPRTGEGPRIGVAPATAAKVKAKVAAALAGIETMKGEIAYVARDPLTGRRERTRWSFAMTESGDFRLKTLGRRHDDVAYDAETGVERSVNASASTGEGRFYAVRTGLAPGRPDQGPSDWVLQRDLGSVVRALLAAKDPRVIETTYKGRPAWQLDVPVPPNLIAADADRFQITIDQETGVPVRVVATLNGKFATELRVEDLVVDADLSSREFKVSFPRRVEVLRTHEGFRRVDELADVEPIVGYAPLVPASLPEGYELAEVAVAENASPTGAEAANPPSRDVVSLSFRRGLDQFIVTTRRSNVRAPGEPQRPLRELWGDPLATGEGFRDEPERITLRDGALDGVEAELLIVPRNVPHLWALTDELVVTVSGDLSREELIDVAESLR